MILIKTTATKEEQAEAFIQDIYSKVDIIRLIVEVLDPNLLQHIIDGTESILEKPIIEGLNTEDKAKAEHKRDLTILNLNIFQGVLDMSDNINDFVKKYHIKPKNGD